MIFLKFLENVLIEKKQRLNTHTVLNFRGDYLKNRCYRLLKRRWLKIKKRRLMNLVAKDFNQ